MEKVVNNLHPPATASQMVLWMSSRKSYFEISFLCYFNYSLSQWSLQTSPSWMGPSSVCFWYWAHISVVWVPCSPLISWQEDIWMFIIIFLYLEANWISVQFSPSVVSLFAAPWTAAHQVSLSITNSCSFLRPMPIESAMPSNRLILCCPLLLLPSSSPASGSLPVSTCISPC